MSFLIYILKGIYNNSHISSTPIDQYEISHISYIWIFHTPSLWTPTGKSKKIKESLFLLAFCCYFVFFFVLLYFCFCIFCLFACLFVSLILKNRKCNWFFSLLNGNVCPGKSFKRLNKIEHNSTVLKLIFFIEFRTWMHLLRSIKLERYLLFFSFLWTVDLQLG